MKELITVIINVYNGEKFLKKCIDSIINQTYKNLEILIINDGSTDKTLDICKSYKDKRVRIITTKNQGLSLSRNEGIDNAKGEYLYFIDADDFIEPDTIEYLYNLCKNYNCDFSTCNPLIIFDYNFTKEIEKEKISIISNYDMLKKVLLLENMAGTTWNKLMKRKLFDDIRFQNRITNDVVVTYKLILKCKKIIYSNQKKYYYLKHQNCISIDGYEKKERSIDFYNAIIERYNELKKIYPKMIENDIGLLRGILKLYLVENEEVQSFLEERKILKKFRKVFSFKMLVSNIKSKEKIKLLLFRINPKLYKKIGIIYRKKYKYKM